MISLTDEQEELAELADGAFLLVAPPGSGKTEVIAQRIVRLIQASPSASYKVLALSFTKNAAGTMRSRVSERLGENSWRVLCTTYHAFCLDLLRHYGYLLGLPAEPTIYDSVEDRLQAFAQGLVAEGLVGDSDTIDRSAAVDALDALGRLERDLVPPDAAPVRDLEGLGIKLRDAYRAYRLALELNGALDFDTVLSRSYELLSTRPEVARQYRTTYRYILIDEAQDTSTAQYELIKALCGSEHRNVFMVADPAQSIYAFRGSSSRFVELFEQEFGARRFELGITFRCGQQILAIAQRLLATRRPRRPDGIQQSASAAGMVEYNAFQDESKEASSTVNWITELIEKGLPRAILGREEKQDLAPEEAAILARSRNHLRQLLDLLDSRGIPYHFSAGESGIFDSDEFRILMYALKVLASPHDIAIARSLLSCIENSSFQVTHGAWPEPGNTPTLLRDVAERLSGTSLAAPIGTLAGFDGNPVSLGSVVDRLIAWDPTSQVTEPDRLELLAGDRNLLKSRWISYRNSVEPSRQTWQGLILELANSPRPEAAGIRVLTVHAAKGLEFRVVGIIGLNEGSFPDFRNTGNESIESERRLMYVAVTRASRALWLSRPCARKTRYGARAQEPSRFILEMGFKPGT